MLSIRCFIQNCASKIRIVAEELCYSTYWTATTHFCRREI